MAPAWGTAGQTETSSEAETDAVPVSLEQARNIVLRSLANAARTRHQLAELLAKRGVSEQISDELLDRFVEVGLINDADFAHTWVKGRHESRCLSRRVLRHELRQKGIDDVTIEIALEQIDDDDEREAALRLAVRKVRSLSRYDVATQRRRLGSMLMRRGYSSEVVARAVA
jgi:regulatory protein